MRGSDKPESSHWAATITFKYSNAPMKENDRAINPLGFQVTEYRNDPDAFTTETTSTPPASAPTTAVSIPTTGVTVFPGQTSAVPALIAPVGQR
jgi:type IV secretion system protein VirB8